MTLYLVRLLLRGSFFLSFICLTLDQENFLLRMMLCLVTSFGAMLLVPNVSRTRRMSMKMNNLVSSFDVNKSLVSFFSLLFPGDLSAESVRGGGDEEDEDEDERNEKLGGKSSSFLK